MMTTLYDILGCEQNATYEELKRKYQELALKLHPDRQTDKSATSFMEIDEAWKILRDSEQRKLYDYQLTQTQLSEQYNIFATLSTADLDFNEMNQTYYYLCRCSGKYVVEQSELRLGDFYVNCEDCSLLIHIVNKEPR